MGLLRRDRRLQRYLVCESISAIGSWATLIALWGAAGYRFDAGAAGVTLIGLGWSMPALVLGPVVGAVIDRIGPRRVLVASQAVALLTSLSMTLAGSFATLVVLGFVNGCCSAFAHPAMAALPPRIVDPVDVASVNALVRLTHSLAIVVGPALGGAAIATVGVDGAFLVDAATYLVGIVGVVQLGRREDRAGQRTADAGPRPSMWRDAGDGLRLARANPMVRRLIGLNAAVGVLYGSAIVLEPLYVRTVLHEPASTFALLQSVFGVTLLGTGLLAVRHAERLARVRHVALSVIASGAFAIVYLGSRSVVVAFIGVACWGVATAFIGAPVATLLQRATPPQAHGRIMALDRSVDAAMKMLATVVAGILSGVAGVRVAALVLASVTVIVGLAGLVRRVEGGAGTPEPVVRARITL